MACSQMRAGGLVVGHELPKLIARVQFPVGALCDFLSLRNEMILGILQKE